MNREIDYGEVWRALGGMKNGKTAGEVGVVVEFLKHLPVAWVGELVEIMNEIFMGRGLVKGWRTSRIYPIHKGGMRMM